MSDSRLDDFARRMDGALEALRKEFAGLRTGRASASLLDPQASGSNMTSGAGAMVSTAMRVVNAIPYVVDANPGLLSALDLPLTLPRHVFL